MAKLRLSSEIVPNVPEEIIEDILLRLPVHSVLRLKCVCRSWCSLFSSNHFIKTHLRMSKEDANFDRHRVVFIPKWRSAIQHCSLRSFLPGTVTEKTKAVWLNQSEIPDILGCCNGLFCIHINGNDLYLWNPSTRKFKNLPKFRDEEESSFIGMFGFGFDEVNEDYKVVCIMKRKRRYWDSLTVYSLKSNSWKPMEMIPTEYRPTANHRGKFANGKLHWGRASRGDDHTDEIVSFDLSRELWVRLEIPIFHGREYSNIWSSIGTVDGFLSVACGCPNGGTDVWVLKQFGKNGSWSRVLNIPFCTRFFVDRQRVQLHIEPNGRIISLGWKDFVIYGLIGGKSVEIKTETCCSFFDGSIYVESLVPLG